jgi:hypothetical protein
MVYKQSAAVASQPRINRVLKNKHQAVSQGTISSKLKAPSSKGKTPSAQLSAFSFELPAAFM